MAVPPSVKPTLPAMAVVFAGRGAGTTLGATVAVKAAVLPAAGLAGEEVTVVVVAAFATARGSVAEALVL